jgi:xylulose-5-phosphate/fructose-6-phosphate phosphoketolase
MMLVNGVSRFDVAERALRVVAEGGHEGVKGGVEGLVGEVRGRGEKVRVVSG